MSGENQDSTVKSEVATEDPPPRKAKRSRTSPPSSRMTTPTPDAAAAAAISAAAAAAAAQAASLGNLPGLFGLLTTTHHGSMPSVDQVRVAATKAVQESPPYVHMSSRDAAPQLKIENSNNKVTGGMSGYRMARASHGVNEGNYYFEVIVLSPPTIAEIKKNLPPNARLGRKLQEQLESSNNDNAAAATTSTVGGNLRIGWAMRTGDLQAPVGYDKWSYGLRDISGSRIHASKREDNWGGEPFGPGDVAGCCICLSPSSESESSSNKKNEIRFFKNGHAMGHVVVRKGKREGGAAFDSVQPGTYYPAISCYMGGTCRVNFGPHFVLEPKSYGLKLRPMCDACDAPQSPQEAVTNATKERIFKKTNDSMVTAFRDAIETEARIRQEAYEAHVRRQVNEVRQLREERNLSTADLPVPKEDATIGMDED